MSFWKMLKWSWDPKKNPAPAEVRYWMTQRVDVTFYAGKGPLGDKVCLTINKDLTNLNYVEGFFDTPRQQLEWIMDGFEETFRKKMFSEGVSHGGLVYPPHAIAKVRFHDPVYGEDDATQD